MVLPRRFLRYLLPWRLLRNALIHLRRAWLHFLIFDELFLFLLKLLTVTFGAGFLLD
jgi:hypothetical protein